jgi:ATP-dependent DNA helicase DinG
VPELPSVPGTISLKDDSADRLGAAVAEAFAPGGPVAAALPGFEPRPGQLAMAAAVSGVFAGGGILLAEAGTGTGKTLAYLVPAVLSGQRVLVSTGTKNLQEQIFFKDLPVLRDALGIAFTSTCMKGRGNYLCLHRFDAYRDGTASFSQIDAGFGRTPDEALFVRVIDEWRRETLTGDRAEIEDLPEDLPLWKDVAATTENCIGAECPQHQECFITRMRQRAAESDIVIVNHHLLCADAAVRQSEYGEVIPACSYAVLDEAHLLEDVATQYFGLAASNYQVEDLARDVDRAVGPAQLPDRECAMALKDAAERLRHCSRIFFAALQMLRFGAPGATGSDNRVRVGGTQMAKAAEEGAALAAAIEALEAEVALARDVPEDVLAAGRRAAEMRTDLAFLLRADDPGFVYYLEVRGRGVFLRASPIDVSSIVRELLLDRMKATVLTSATLTVDGGFDYIRSRLGIRRAEELRLPSEFDYTTRAILYLPKRMPDPRSREFAPAVARQVVEIIKRTRGRAFVLFTSYANLREVQALASAEIEYPILVHGTAPRSALLRDFKATPNAVLLATSSFWQGVDVVGEALSCVIIDKLPFASPGDPITSARIEAITARGGSPFGEYQIPMAVLALQQGLGRLLRHRQDRGVLAVLDPRLRTMGYGRRFRESLPPAPVTCELADIDSFFAAAPRQSGDGELSADRTESL